jgi:hypothetical protein
MSSLAMGLGAFTSQDQVDINQYVDNLAKKFPQANLTILIPKFIQV